MTVPPFENNNPYAHASQPWNQPTSGDGSTTQFTLLGISFLVLSLFGLAFSMLIAAAVLIQYASGEAVPPPDALESERLGFYLGYWGFFAASVISAMIQPIIAIAGINLLRRKGLGLAKIGSVLMCIPCISSCCLVGIPFGIWAIVVLNGESAKRHFS